LQPRIKLFDWPASPFSLKVRAILEYKRLDYMRVPILAPANFWDVYRRGKVGKAPALEIDGRLYVDSTDIAYELEHRFPDPAIVPTTPQEQALCHALEEWSDESLYFVNLYYQWHDPEGLKMVPKAFGSGLFGRAAYRFYLRRVLKQIHGQGTARKLPEHVLSDLQRHLAAIDALVEPKPFLLGDGPFLCDFALLGQLVYLGRTPVGSRRLAEHPAIEAYVSRMKALRAAHERS
jgi:glutathione S-transferase